MVNELAGSWWSLVLRGVIAILFALAIFFFPTLALDVLLLVLGVYLVLDGILALIAGLTREEHESRRRWLTILEGLMGLIIGGLILVFPSLALIAFVYFFAAWAILTGVLEIATAIQLRKELKNELLLIISGILSVIFGILAMFYPSTGAIVILYIIAIYEFIFGLDYFILGFRMLAMKRSASRGNSAPPNIP
jgi:uncharacterized membrane protein HdeD (DUF308 family)